LLALRLEVAYVGPTNITERSWVYRLPVVSLSNGYYLDGWLSAGRWTISVCNQPIMLTQPSIPPGCINRVPAYLAGVKAGRVHLCPGGR